eukprot:Em0001g806a
MMLLAVMDPAGSRQRRMRRLQRRRHIAAYVFEPSLRKELHESKVRWNQHRIRYNRRAVCPGGVPDDLYTLSDDCKQDIDPDVLAFLLVKYGCDAPGFYPEEFGALASHFLAIIQLTQDEITPTNFALVDSVEIEESCPRIASYQLHWSNTPAVNASQYYRRTSTIPILNHLITEPDNRFEEAAAGTQFAGSQFGSNQNSAQEGLKESVEAHQLAICYQSECLHQLELRLKREGELLKRCQSQFDAMVEKLGRLTPHPKADDTASAISTDYSRLKIRLLKESVEAHQLAICYQSECLHQLELRLKREGVLLKRCQSQFDAMVEKLGRLTPHPKADDTASAISTDYSRIGLSNISDQVIATQQRDSGLIAASLLPTPEDDVALRDNICVLMSRILCEHVEFFKFAFEEVVDRHIKHEFNDEMSTKSIVNPLGNIPKNENRTENMVGIMTESQQYVPMVEMMKYVYVPSLKRTAKVATAIAHRILFAGWAARARGAQKANVHEVSPSMSTKDYPAESVLQGADNMWTLPDEKTQKCLKELCGRVYDKFVCFNYNTAVLASPDSDKVYEYSVQLLHLACFYMEFADAIREGDGFGNNNYACVAANILVQYFYTLSPQLSAQLLCSHFVNVHGKPGSNIPVDLHMEHLNKIAKGCIGFLGCNKSQTVIQRIGRATCIGTLTPILENLNKHYKQKKPQATKDVAVVVDELLKAKSFDIKQKGRKDTSFPNPKDVLHGKIKNEIFE